MIGRKLIVLQNEQGPAEYLSAESVSFEIPYIKEIRSATARNIKKYAHVTLVTTLRIYIRSNNFAKNKYQEAKIKIKNKRARSRLNGDMPEGQASSFLKKMSDYKHKIRKIKQKIREEEDN
jgi:hypothetical protein